MTACASRSGSCPAACTRRREHSDKAVADAGLLLAERQVTGHLDHLAKVRDQARGAGGRLEAVVDAYALFS